MFYYSKRTTSPPSPSVVFMFLFTSLYYRCFKTFDPPSSCSPLTETSDYLEFVFLFLYGTTHLYASNYGFLCHHSQPISTETPSSFPSRFLPCSYSEDKKVFSEYFGKLRNLVYLYILKLLYF